jgi:hypothetical protein
MFGFPSERITLYVCVLQLMMTTLWMKYVVSRNKNKKVLTKVCVMANLNTLNIIQTCTSYSICNIYIILSCSLEAYIYRQYLTDFMELYTFYMKCIMKPTVPLSMAMLTSGWYTTQNLPLMQYLSFFLFASIRFCTPTLCCQGTNEIGKNVPKT